jgi:hypothetical protein
MNKIEIAYNEMNVPSDVISEEKFESICVLLETIEPSVIADFIAGGSEGWDNAEEHIEWLGNAPAGEIASWVQAGQ